jgi:hypothetical protein
MLDKVTAQNNGTVQTGSYDSTSDAQTPPLPPLGVWGSAVLEIIENQLDFKFIGNRLPTAGSQQFAIKDNFTIYRLVPPSNFTTTVNGSSVDASWSPVRGANAYVVQRADFPDGPFQLLYEGPNTGTGDGPNQGWEAYYYRVAMKTINGTLGPWAYATFSLNPPSNYPGLSASVTYQLGYASILVTLSGSWEGTVGVGRSVDNGATYTQIFAGTQEDYDFAGGNSYGGILTNPTPGITSIKFKVGTQVVTLGLAPSPPVIDYTYAYGSGVDLNVTASGAGAESFTILRSDTSGGPYSTVGTTPNGAFTDTTVQSGHTYYYVAKAVQFGISSANSSEVPVSN